MGYGFCYNYGFNHNEEKYNFAFGGDCNLSFSRDYNLAFSENYDFSLSRNCNFSFDGNYKFPFGKNYNFSFGGNCNFGNYDFANSKCEKYFIRYGFWRIYGFCDNLNGFLFNRKNLKRN